MSAVVIIPARYGSSRFPAKMLAADSGRPLVQHVVDRVRQCRRIRAVIVATDDQRIANALRPFGTHAVMTSPDHQSGTDRIAEVARELSDEIIINVQGDEPEIEPEVVDRLVDRLEQGREPMVTAATEFPAGADPNDPNLVKVVLAGDGRALYFSRAPIPYRRDPQSSGNAPFLLHLGVYGYRREFLLQYTQWPQTPAELTEKLEQLRVLENGHPIHVLLVRRAVHGIDTPQQYQAFLARQRQACAG
ncbi:MAG: 3-deoxy-manno-octulosonate cytidylyltransferase [Phycisphaerae bacterium]|nr:3-deoxy-manno-octulosonate cytidylyltransferase [Phycisphaerae bacterium]MDW8262741.1 3-deoxy-manno-octulosonate cytidylyltransferase [Phycisphaerales bacterium]